MGCHLFYLDVWVVWLRQGLQGVLTRHDKGNQVLRRAQKLGSDWARHRYFLTVPLNLLHCDWGCHGDLLALCPIPARVLPEDEAGDLLEPRTHGCLHISFLQDNFSYQVGGILSDLDSGLSRKSKPCFSPPDSPQNRILGFFAFEVHLPITQSVPGQQKQGSYASCNSQSYRQYSHCKQWEFVI